MIKRISKKLFFILCLLTATYQLSAQDKLMQILDEELKREFEVLKTQKSPIYYLSYRVEEVYSKHVSSSFGNLISRSEENDKLPFRVLTVEVRIGTPQLDNTHELKKQQSESSATYLGSIYLPIEDNELAIKQAIWKETDKQYQRAIRDFSKVKSDEATTVGSEDKTGDFNLTSKPELYFEPAIDYSKITINSDEWIKRSKKYSELFLKDSSIFYSNSSFRYEIVRKYFVSSEGSKIAYNNENTRASIMAVTKANDGMELPLFESFYSFKPNGLPSDAEMMAKAQIMLSNLTALKTAPMADSFTGPALLSGAASGVFFHEIFGHRIEGYRMKNATDAQTFTKKINEPVLPLDFSIYFDPQLKKIYNFDLYGSYIYDDEGIKGQRVDIVKNGILKDFLMSRRPIQNFPQSNGHGRAQSGMLPVSRQSNLIIETPSKLTEDDLRKELIKLVKEQNKEYGYFFKNVTGGFTSTSTIMPNAFNVTPTIVYKVYTDGRPDELIRGVDLIGTPLSVFSSIQNSGGKNDVFTGTCGAESGGVPVSSVSPMILVNKIETQKKHKSSEKPYILPRPDDSVSK